MARRVLLVELFPRLPATGAMMPVRLICGATIRADHFGVQWLPYLEGFPSFVSRLGFDGRAFGSGAIPSVGELTVNMDRGTQDSWLGLIWENAACTLKLGLDTDLDANFATIWTGKASGIRLAGNKMTIQLADQGEELRRPVLTVSFAGTGDLEGDADQKGQLKPRGWGEVENVAGILIDKINNIWLMIDGPSTITAVYDGGAAFVIAADYPTLAALRSATIPQGKVATCNALSLVRPWTTPKYVLSADLKAASTGAYTSKPAEIAAAVLGASGSALSFATGQVAAFNAQEAGPIGFYLSDASTVEASLNTIFAGITGWWRLHSDGQLRCGRWGFGASVLSVEDYEVLDVSRSVVLTPTYKRTVGYRRNWRPMQESEIAGIILAADVYGLGELATQNTVDFATQIVGAEKPEAGATRTEMQGVYSATVQYRKGDIVTFSNASYYCTATPPAAGHPPSEAAYWTVWVVSGSGKSLVFKRAGTQPPTPTGAPNPPEGWSDGPPTGTNPLWMSSATIDASGAATGAWAAPARVDAPGQTVQWSVDGTASWHATFAAGDKYMRTSFDGGVTWGAAIKVVGENGATGPQGPQGATGPQGVPGPAGANGQTTYTWIRYATSATGAGISNDPTGKTYIGFAYNKTTATESDLPADYKWTLIQGPQGNTGVQGPAGANGQTTYTWIKYSANADGSGLTDTPQADTAYIGIAVNKTTAAESDVPADYAWSRWKGDQGPGADQLVTVSGQQWNFAGGSAQG